MKKILFVCVHNSGRSQMAKAFVECSGSQLVEAYSAGTMPDAEVDPIVVEVMNEVDIDISENRPRLITQDIVDSCEKVITMGCSIDEACPTSSSFRRTGALLIQKVSTLMRLEE